MSYDFYLDDEKINVLLMGISGAGKSTLINSVMGKEVALTGDGFSQTKEMKLYEDDDLPFRLVDSVGFEYGLLQQQKTKYEISKWSKEGAKEKDASKYIHIIWFCIGSQDNRISNESLDYLRRISKVWKNIPIVIVFTKSLSNSVADANKKMFEKVVAEYKKKDHLNVKGIVPVLAKEVELDDKVLPVSGLEELINVTNELIPDAKRINQETLTKLAIKFRRNKANAFVALATTGAITVGAVPIPFPDSTILVPIQTTMITEISKLYDVDNEIQDKVKKALVEVGITTLAGKTLIGYLKGGNVPMAMLNAAVAGCITVVLGEASVIVYENALNRVIDLNNIEINGYVEEVVKGLIPKYGKVLLNTITNGDKDIDDKINAGEIVKDLAKVFLKVDVDEQLEGK